MSEITGRIMLPVAQSKPGVKTAPSKAPLCWEEMSKQERRLYVQAEQEFETNMVSAQVLEEARKRSQNAEKIERNYVRLRYQQLWSHAAKQQRKLEERETRRQKIVEELDERERQNGLPSETSLGKGLAVATISILAIAALAVLAFAMVNFLSPS